MNIFNRLKSISTHIFATTPLSGAYTTLMLVLGSLTEGITLLVLLPLMQVLGASNGENTAISLPNPASGAGWSNQFSLEQILIAFAVLVAVSAVFTRYKVIFLAKMVHENMSRLRMDIFSSVARSNWAEITKIKSSDVGNALTGEMDRIQIALTGLFLAAQSLIFLTVYIVVSFFISVPMTLLAMAGGLIMFLSLNRVRRKSTSLGEEITRERNSLYSLITDMLSGLKITKSLNAEERYEEQLRAVIGKLQTIMLDYARSATLTGTVFQVATVVIGCLFIWVARKFYILPFSEIIVLLLVFSRIVPRFRDLQEQLQPILLNMPAFEAVMDLRRHSLKHAEHWAKPQEGVLPQLSSSITFDKVRYEVEGRTIINDVTFSIEINKITALTGVSGSGKTTIADLLMGLIPATAGTISIDGAHLEGERVRAWRDQIGYVPQDALLLPMSIAANLKLARPTATEAEMLDALERANARTIIEQLPEGLHSVIGDGGARLSGGERQRIAIARALLRRPSLLVLDEITSALDAENTRIIVDALHRMKGQTTILLITHSAEVLGVADSEIRL